MDLAVSTRGLTRRFGAQVAVDHLDLEVGRGRFFGFLGPNGAGKSTTINMLTGLLRIDAGRAAVLGHDVTDDPVAVKQRIGVVPERLGLFDRLTAREQLLFVGEMYGLEQATVDERCRELLELMELDGPRKLIVDLSHGMRKKLALAAALIHEPELLFLDEPFEGIDAISSRLIKDLLATLVARGVTVFLTSHILEIVERLCDEIAIIHRGRLVAQGRLEELRQDLARAAGEDHDDRPDEPAGLEELFLRVVGTGEGHRRSLSWLG